MKRIKNAAAQIGFGLGAVYGFFLIPAIDNLFADNFVLLLRQVVAMAFAACLLVNPRALIELGETYAPKIISIISMLFTNSNNNTKNEK